MKFWASTAFTDISQYTHLARYCEEAGVHGLLIIDKDKNDVEVREAQYNLKYAQAAQRMVQSDLAHYEKCIRIATLDLERLSKGPQ